MVYPITAQFIFTGMCQEQTVYLCISLFPNTVHIHQQQYGHDQKSMHIVILLKIWRSFDDRTWPSDRIHVADKAGQCKKLMLFWASKCVVIRAV